MRRHWRVLTAVLCLVAAAAACTRARKPRERGELTEAEKAVVAAFTSGTISRESAVRVAFHDGVARPEQVGAPLDASPFRFEPRIKGTAVWAAPDRIEFRPAERLPDGQTYAASLDLAPLLPAGRTPLARFDFVFSTMRQSFDVAVDGLQAADATDVKRQALTGRLVTADVEEAPGVEKVLRASFAGRDLPVAWTHETNRRVHAFTVGGIERTEAASALRLSWDGGPIGVDRKEAREIAVPGLDTFTVDQARVVVAPEPHVELRFTDPLKPGQNLKGLVRIGDRDDLRFVADGSRLEVYGTKGWRGQQTVRVEAGVRNVLGYRMKEARELTVQFELLKPAVRFAGKGVIVPTSAGFTIPIEAVNLRAVTVEALQVPSSNMPQFLQTNTLEGEQELQRVGRVVWRKTLSLELTADKENRWLPVGLDVSPLLAKSPGGMYRLTLSFRRPHVAWPCQGAAGPEAEPPARAESDEQEQSNWDSWEENEGGDWDQRFENRDNPCHPAYYQRFYDHDIRAARNVLVSDLGLMAKAGEDDTVIVFANDLRTTEPIAGAEVALLDYQQQTLGSSRTDRDGIARIAVERPAFLATVRHAGQTGYLRLDGGSALPMAHFDVAGTRSPRGLKGFLYGERGIWRPGDTMHLVFVLNDPTKRLAADHPVRFDLVDPRDQLVRTLTRTQSTDGFYAFEVATSPDAPTGNYTGRVSVGGATFDKTLKVETVMPNRLKIAMDFGTDQLRAKSRISGVLSAAWLHGAPARSLKADVELALSPARTSFKRFEEFVFDDPTRKYETERQKIFEGSLDPTGQARIAATVAAEAMAPGKLRADLTTRVFEPGGAFSIDRFSIPYSPYERYVGLRTPKGDKTRGMILTDTKHRVDVALVDSDGASGGDGEVEVKLYKVDWRWWWERGEEDLAAWADANVHTPLQAAVVKVANGAGAWELEIKYPEWGRYLLTATDRTGGHRAGKIVYIDWPGWAGRGQKEGGGGASILAFAADKPEYAPGETVTLRVPTPRKGRGLVSLESGSRVLRTEWIEAKGEETRYTFTATAEMAPNVYAHVTLLQPHAQTANDLPIRLYGVAPVKVVNPQTRLQPVLEVPEVLAPETTSTLSVREAAGRPMAYTLAVVDEGLLGLTRYATPNPWDHFYAREALAVRTWDLYDEVVGAYGAAMERMLAVGGDEAAVSAKGRRANRFPPMVRFLGPFRLAAKATGTHRIEIPQYVGAVRVMVVAGRDGAFGAAEKSAFVRRPLMLLATLPRVLGPDESVALPVSVFALDPKVKDVALSVSTSGPLEVVNEAKKALSFAAVGDEVIDFRLKTKPGLGVATATVTATSGAERASQKIELDVRSSTARVTDVLGGTIKPGESWAPEGPFPGLAGTNQATLEVSRVPPVDLGRRLEYLLAYPHGCVEQTVSAAFPQLFLGKLLELTPEKQARVETNVKAALERLRRFQASDGGFGTWPGDDDSADWATNYAGHFAVEAQKAGYLPPPGLLDQWTSFQRRRARGWVPGEGQAELTQAYRLFTLALVGAAELPAMNQLRERASLPVAAKWRLAAAYQLAAQPEAARALAAGGPVTIAPYRELGGTYGSDLRDRAMVLEAVVLLGMAEHVGPLAKSLSESLSKNTWLSTQETAYALLALSKAVTDPRGEAKSAFSFEWNGGAATAVTSASPIVERRLEVGKAAAPRLVVRNTGTTVLYPRLILSGLPPVGRETAASNGFSLEVQILTPDGKPLDPSRLDQGTDFKTVVKVTNSGVRGDYREVALSQVVASGWEIRNDRLDPSRRRASSAFEHQDVRDDRVYTYFDLKAGETKTVEVAMNASYLGRFYLPMVTVEAMYDATLNARAKGQWVEVVAPGQ
ncbi:MAG TPA: MG2 domain-containing protein [Vicinamibacteria bacterium]|nr:MG2 domain-containing protein [Vicinamibacteria bacterium]